jgi:hypothetical protein
MTLPDTFVERAVRIAQRATAGEDSSVGLTAFEASSIRQRFGWGEGHITALDARCWCGTVHHGGNDD